ncbi:type IV secretory system conjugative DNA transfer family protein [Candidatus Peregrinibacteria bacterium]|jgi:hypothetical protein|nr:type IV secretory system conjugative DNA transfer family protein [Candidatus Peregrinibacteria bacterium]MBT3598653.1 type IV secretory system conjugative DNA transfer family protein [Candidatus Peregrinibacteria bacterium]MBT4367305.1 type IV secretory system conjugative DNA transfer family protein [Candidatus Peregrinibacteria bacterium]MBT4585815.1 type IV secretory system conjugative DNA transfer family protein [Candidatus Peregrinibacteria bacterium]MBT6730948.1 type IV secretory system
MPESIRNIIEAEIWTSIGTWFINDPVRNIIFFLLAFVGIIAFKKLARLAYAIHHAKHLVCLKVIMPRNDSKLDQEKRTDKDFKEKLAGMEQLYRALWEVKSLTIWQALHFFIWRYIPISMEMFLEKGVLNFYVVTAPKYVAIVEKQITAFYPSAEVYPEKSPDIWPKGSKLVGYNMEFKKLFVYPIRFYEQMQDDPLNSLANVLSKLEDGELATIQIVMTPAYWNKWGKKAKRYASTMFKGKKVKWFSFIKIPLIGEFAYLPLVIGTLLMALFFEQLFTGGGVIPLIVIGVLGILVATIGPGSSGSKSMAPGAREGDAFIRMIQPEEELYKRMGEKAGMSFFICSVRILASGKTWQRSLEITNNIQVAFNVFKDLYGNYFMNRRMFIGFMPLVFNAPIIYKLWKLRLIGFFSDVCPLTEKELASMYHFPDSRYNNMPVIEWSTYKVLPPPPETPKEGIVLGENKHRGGNTQVRFFEKDRTRHHYIIGKSGSGKSAFLSWMSRQDINNGEGVCMVDPHGDLIEDALAHIPKSRAKDVIVFDPSDTERPMGLNLLEAKTQDEKDRAALDAMEIFIKLFGNEIFGPRIQHYFRNGCLTLMDDEEEGATLIDVPRLFVDEEFQRYKVTKIRNPVVRSFWEHEIAQTGEREKQEMIPYFSSKFGPFITNTTMRNIIGQPKSAFNIREVMDNRKVLLVNLSKGRIGDTNAELLGLIFVNKISMSALSRADIPRSERKRFYLYVDEFQNFVTDAFATILSEARKYELGLIMAHQYIGQLVGKTSSYGESNTKMRDAVFGNVGTISSFKIGAEDAEYMAKEFAPVLSEQDVIGIPNFNCYMKLSINNVQSRPFSLKTIYDESGRNEELSKLIREYSRLKHARKKVFVNQEIEDRIGIAR